VALSINVTVPIGSVEPLAATAVRVTALPSTAVFALEVSAVTVAGSGVLVLAQFASKLATSMEPRPVTRS